MATHLSVIKRAEGSGHMRSMTQLFFRDDVTPNNNSKVFCRIEWDKAAIDGIGGATKTAFLAGFVANLQTAIDTGAFETQIDIT